MHCVLPVKQVNQVSKSQPIMLDYPERGELIVGKSFKSQSFKTAGNPLIRPFNYPPPVIAAPTTNFRPAPLFRFQFSSQFFE